MKRITAIVQGDVQSVGYRDRVLKSARKFNIRGFVENLKPYDVKIIAEGEEDSLNKFLEEIKIKRYPIMVEDINVKWEEPRDEFEYFEIKRGDWKDELGERMDMAGTFLYRSVEIGEENLSIGKENLSIGKENLSVAKENLSIGKENLSVAKSIKEDTKSIPSIKEDTTVIKGSLKSLEEIYKETIELHHKYDKLEKDVELIKDKLSIP